MRESELLRAYGAAPPPRRRRWRVRPWSWYLEHPTLPRLPSVKARPLFDITDGQKIIGPFHTEAAAQLAANSRNAWPAADAAALGRLDPLEARAVDGDR